MSDSGTGTPERRRTSTFVFGLVVMMVGAGIFCAVALYTQALERRMLHAATINEQLTSAGDLRATAEVVQAVRQMKLVTVEVNTRTSAVVAHESWRGDISARVEAPAKLLYGADLSGLETDAVAYSPASRAWAIRIPAPSRIATEVCTKEESVNVEVGWLRLRSRAGEYYLGLARRDLYERARELVLGPEDATMVRDVTRGQVEELVRRIVGNDAEVVVVFDDGVLP